MDVARPLDEFAQDAEGPFNVPEGMFDEKLLPLGLGAGELAWKGPGSLAGRRFGPEQFLENAAHVGGMRAVGGFKLLERGQAHKPGQALEGVTGGRKRVGLEVVLHLEPVLDIAQETVGPREHPRLLAGDAFVLGQLGQAWKSLGALKERLPPGVQELLGLGDELDFPDAAATQLDVALQLSGL